jgi:hypothetical protein
MIWVKVEDPLESYLCFLNISKSEVAEANAKSYGRRALRVLFKDLSELSEALLILSLAEVNQSLNYQGKHILRLITFHVV